MADNNFPAKPGQGDRKNNNRQGGNNNNNNRNKNGYYHKKNGNFKYNKNKNFNNNRPQRKDPAVETVDDIQADMQRISKEIDLEIKEIGSMTLG